MSDPIVIVGAGIAGLALALALKRRGLHACIVERRDALPLDGAGIQIGPNGTRCLRDLGVLEDVRASASVPPCILVHEGASGRLITRLPLGAWIEARHGTPYWVTRRADLARALYGAVLDAGVEVQFGVDVRGAHSTAHGACVMCADGATIDAPGVIGADGVWSGVRAGMFGDADIRRDGRVAARATIAASTSNGIRSDAVSVWLAAETHLVAYPVQNGTSINVVLISQGDSPFERWSQPVEADVVRRRLGAFAQPMSGLADTADWRQWPLVRRDPLAHYAEGRIALVGDAAHPMSPYLAQGAVMALEDALTLADVLARTRGDAGDISPGLAAYSALRLARTQRVVRTAEQQGRIYHLAGPMRFARDLVLRLSPPQLTMRRYDWLYGETWSRNTRIS